MEFAMALVEWVICSSLLAYLATTRSASRARFLVASGSLPPGVPANFYARVCEVARHCGTLFVLDTSGPALASAGCGMFLIKASLRELEGLTGHSIQSEGA